MNRGSSRMMNEIKELQRSFNEAPIHESGK